MYGNRLKELRTENGWTMEEVGKNVGIKSLVMPRMNRNIVNLHLTN
jgi:transcriptional regulator with XRE-family HTH domain